MTVLSTTSTNRKLVRESRASTRMDMANQIIIARSLNGTLLSVNIPSLLEKQFVFDLVFQDEFRAQTFQDIVENTKA
jgi:hypothetical protein